MKTFNLTKKEIKYLSELIAALIVAGPEDKVMEAVMDFYKKSKSEVNKPCL